MALIGTIPVIEKQLALTPHFEQALAYLKEACDPASAVHARILAVPEGEMQRVELGDGLFALEQAYLGKTRDEARLENHAKHIDLQLMIVSDELMEVTTTEGLKVTEDALADRDVCFFEHSPSVSLLYVRPGEVAVFYPEDVHKPSLAVREPVLARKTVVKVPV